MYATYITGTAQNILSILRSGGPIVWSWGPHSLRAVTYNGMAALRFPVNGFVHKGDIVVAHNRGSDLYEVYLLWCGSEGDDKVVSSRGGIYFDEVIDVIDRLVEKDCSVDEYKRKTGKWLEDNPR